MNLFIVSVMMASVYLHSKISKLINDLVYQHSRWSIILPYYFKVKNGKQYDIYFEVRTVTAIIERPIGKDSS
jgi:hypothetical protein